MFRLGKLDMRHPSWVCNQFILSGPNLCWQILGVKMLFEATSCNDTKRDPTTTLTQHWAPGLLSTKVLQAKRVEQDLGRTSWAKSNCAVWSSQDGCFFWLILSKGRTVFLFESQTARQFFTKILAFHRIPPLVCHNGHDPALTCRETWKRRSVPVWSYAFTLLCSLVSEKSPLDDTLDGSEIRRENQLRLVVYSTFRVLIHLRWWSPEFGTINSMSLREGGHCY